MTTDQPFLAIDTATRTPVLGLVSTDGELRAERTWQSQHRHGEQLLQELDSLLAELSVDRHDLGGVVVGTGPGSFTGLRIGLATAKVIAYSLNVPIVGISTTHALALAASPTGGSAELAVSLPAGVADRYVHRFSLVDEFVSEVGQPQLVAGAEAFRSAVGGAILVAVDLEADEVGPEAVERGESAVHRLAGALARLGAAAITGGGSDAVARLVPAYVALPRGIAASVVDMTWSPDLR